MVTPEEDTTLNDNAQGTNNFAAPGAHRYKIGLSLKRLPIGGTDSIKFVELIRIKAVSYTHLPSPRDRG